eukprot:3000233-Amphidinium_carterae.1
MQFNRSNFVRFVVMSSLCPLTLVGMGEAGDRFHRSCARDKRSDDFCRADNCFSGRNGRSRAESLSHAIMMSGQEA